MVVILNKPNQPDYSLTKAYWPISLLECASKLMEEIIAKRVNMDIATHHLIPMTQFGLRPHHNTVDAVTTIIHHIQATLTTGSTGTLLLFNILGFFDNINTRCITQILRAKGFPPCLCNWVRSFLSDQQASLKLGPLVSDPFTISNGTPQGSLLLPILSALYTASLLDLAGRWIHCDLTLYIDNGAIYAVSTTTSATTTSAIAGFEAILIWLCNNGLSANLAAPHHHYHLHTLPGGVPHQRPQVGQACQHHGQPCTVHHPQHQHPRQFGPWP